MVNEKYKNVTVQLEPDLLGKIDERASALDLNRSQFLRRLVKKELGIGIQELSLPAVNPHPEPAHA